MSFDVLAMPTFAIQHVGWHETESAAISQSHRVADCLRRDNRMSDIPIKSTPVNISNIISFFKSTHTRAQKSKLGANGILHVYIIVNEAPIIIFCITYGRTGVLARELPLIIRALYLIFV